jgi:hypothetical protein
VTMLMNSLAVLGVMGSLAGAAGTQAADMLVYVAVNGSDEWSGKLAAPNKSGTDGPLRTIEHAINVVRRARAEGALTQHARIVIRAGTYYLPRTIMLGAEDSRLTIEAAAGEQVVISGGRRVGGWKPWKGKILQAGLSGVELPDLDFRELYYNGQLQPWARVPNFDPDHPRTGGFLQNAGIVEPNTKTKFRYREGELHPEKWAHPERAWIMFHDSLNYETQFCPVKSIDPANRVVEAAQGVYVLSIGNPFYVCGILEEIDVPGEWCVDPDSKTLYFWPPSGDPNKDGQVIVPALQSAFVMKGDAAADKWVEDLRLSRLAIRDCRGRAINLTAARRCTIAACDLRNVGVGVFLGDDTHDCRIVGCDITQTQGDGVTVWGSTPDHERVTGHTIDNNYIWNYGWGRIHNRCGGVFMVRCMRCKVTHNHIHDGPRYAIGMDTGGECEIAYNYCHHVNLVTLDTGIIEAATAWDWSLAIEQQLERHRKWNWGNSIHHNLLHDSGGWGTNVSTGKLEAPLFSWGIYLDTHCSGWHVHDNVIYNTVLGAYMVNGGMDNVFENNICVDGKEAQCFLETWPKYPMSGNVVQRNIFAYRGKTADAYRNPRFSLENGVYRNNLLWADGYPITVDGLRGVSRKDSWEAWLKLGQDEGSIVADPQFVAPFKRDYRLRPTSPAFKVGFRPIDLSNVGNYASAERRTWPRREEKVVRDSMDYTPPETIRAKQPPLRDYEDYAVGEPERNAHVGNKGAGTALVTDETAASGKHSLKFTDAAGIGPSFFPYVTYPLTQENGILRMSFDLRWETGTLMALDWRDDPYDYNMGPNLTTGPDGTLLANGNEVLHLPPGQWVHIEIVCGLGPQATGKYDLTVTLPDQQPRVFRGLECSPKFRTLNCIVFMAVGDATGVFYVDNLAFLPSGTE